MMGLTDWLRFLFAGWGLPFSIYVLLQTIGLLTLHGPHRRAALIPLPIMCVVLVITLASLSGGSNMWPVFLILTSPLAAIFLLVVIVVAFFFPKPQSGHRPSIRGE